MVTLLLRCFVYLLLVSGLLAFPARVKADPVVDAANQFGFHLLDQIAHASAGTDANTFLSPLSISQALDLALIGSGGQTRVEMAKTLMVGGASNAEIGASSENLLGALSNADPRVKISIANAIWVQEEFPLELSYRAECAKYFDAGMDTLNFADGAGAARTINAWVNAKTEGKIPEMVSPQSVQGSKLVITNAVYFHGYWRDPFYVNQTHDGPFTTSLGETVTLPMMNKTGMFKMLRNARFQAVRLPYGDVGQLSMLVVMPVGDSSLESLTGDGGAHLADIEGLMKMERVALTFPRFHVDNGVDLKVPLTALGMKSAFTNRANFSLLSKGPLKISDVIHKSLIDVDENGTVAAASTGVMMRSLAMPVARPVIIRIDHPFLCAIQDEKSGAFLFLGVINHPSAR